MAARPKFRVLRLLHGEPARAEINSPRSGVRLLLRSTGLALGKIARKPSAERPCEPNHSPLPTTPNRTRTPPTNPNNDSRHHLRKMGKVHGSLARAGKVRSQCPKVAKQERTKKKLQGRAKKRCLYNNRFAITTPHGGRRKMNPAPAGKMG
ncbi:hypothetical protein PSTG_14247 [Puccinia striiformis f. sp. tritici PST-78]|uniref:Uncharacterized protein n=2 Tax=Puccinia striiformis TaxID=27350 RepID=A0A0L0UZ65_9BASI|nr:hypothetical protein PSTG_14247 [Puccinia striiformis f. sp. tritici PST-78]